MRASLEEERLATLDFLHSSTTHVCAWLASCPAPCVLKQSLIHILAASTGWHPGLQHWLAPDSSKAHMLLNVKRWKAFHVPQ